MIKKINMASIIQIIRKAKSSTSFFLFISIFLIILNILDVKSTHLFASEFKSKVKSNEIAPLIPINDRYPLQLDEQNKKMSEILAEDQRVQNQKIFKSHTLPWGWGFLIGSSVIFWIFLKSVIVLKSKSKSKSKSP